MHDFIHPRTARMTRAGLVPMAGALALLAGCEGYERIDLDLAEHRTAVAERADAVEPLHAFALRLAAHDDARGADRFDLSDGLSPAEGEVLALFFNPDLRLARLDAGVALATLETAGLWEDPEFGFDGAEIISPSAPFQYGLTLSLTIPISGRLEVEKARAGALHEAQLRRVVDAEWSTRAAVRRAWAMWSASDERVRLVRATLDQLERVAAIADRLEAAGELMRVEARLLRIELAARRTDLGRAEFAVRRDRLELLALMGLAPDAPITFVRAPLATDAASPSTSVDRLIENNTLLAVRRAEYHAAEESLRLEVREQFPDITIGGGYGSEDRDDRLLLGVSVPIPILNANRAAIAETRARRELARAAAETTFERLAHELARAESFLDVARAERAAFESTMVPLLEEQAAEVDQLAQLGEVDTLLFLETIARMHDAKVRLVDLRLAELDAATTLTHLLGPREPSAPAPVAAPVTPDERTTLTAAARTVSADGIAP